MKKIFETKVENKLYTPPGYGPYRYEIKNIKLENIVDDLWGIGPTMIKDTPHFKYTSGNRRPLEKYFESCKGHTWARKGTPAENMTVDELIGEFDVLLTSDKKYLEPPFHEHYIIVSSNWRCIDGLRRACVLLSNNVETAPVAWVF